MHQGKHLFLFGVLTLLTLFCRAQAESAQYTRDTAMVNSLLKDCENYMVSDGEKAIILGNKAKDLAHKVNYKAGESRALKLVGNLFYYKGEVINALNFWNASLAILRQLNDELGIAKILGNIGAAYAFQEDDVKSLEYHLEALKLAEKLNDKQLQFKQLNNIAGVYFNKEATWDKAYDYLMRVLAMSKQTTVDSSFLGNALTNLGTIALNKNQLEQAESFFNRAMEVSGEKNKVLLPSILNGLGKLSLKRGEIEKAKHYHEQAIAVADKVNGQVLIQAYVGLAEIYMKMKQPAIAFRNYKLAEETANKMSATAELRDVYEKMALAYAGEKNYTSAFDYQLKLDKLKDALYDEKIRKKVGLLQLDFDLQKKQGEVDLLTKDKALKEAELNRQRTLRWAFTGGFILVFFIAFIIYRNYRAKVKINKILDHQKEQIEQLLLNILPVEVAKELQEHGQATPRNYESVSVLFTDFKGFTSIADKMTPAELVEELNTCFMAFDDIIVRHNLEKIKTIGDSYMCAGGIPTPDDHHVANMVKASLEIQEYIRRNNERRLELGLVPWEARVGVHVGPIVAGVVGKKKYAYDIWGSTVNIASRMESNGAPGRVNISSAVYEKIKDKYACTYRGKIYAKNVGEVDMYFIERELQPGEPIPVIEVPKESEIKAEQLLQ